MRKLISAVVITFNEEKNILRCLKSIDWTDEIVLVDSFSHDKTVDIARSFGAKIFQHTYDSYTKQIEYAVNKSTHDWVFIVDADEECTQELHLEIQHLLSTEDEAFHGYDVPRRMYFLGRWIKSGGWYPDYQFRFFKRDFVYIDHQEVHGAFSAKGQIGKLKHDINHFSYPTLFDYVNKINTYTSLMVTVKLNDGWNKKIHWYNLLFHPLSYFLRIFFTHRGFKDGLQGLILALCSSIYNFIMYAKLWEYQRSKSNALNLPPITNKDFQSRKL